MNLMKLLAPDFLVGRTLALIRSLWDSALLLTRQPNRRTLHLLRLVYRVKPRFTMVTNSNLINLYQLAVDANRLNLPGDLVECGVWNGGSAAMMGLADIESARPIGPRAMWLFDSFQGLPRPSERDGKQEQAAYFAGWNLGSTANVMRAFERLGVSLNNVHIMVGWFHNTLSTAGIDKIAVLHIDADWYESVMLVLRSFYDKVVPGGYIVLDDYGYWAGCNQAVKDFLTERAIGFVEIRETGRVGAFFQKPDRASRES